jgi:O-antigen/teichoic acid export membrane protein
MDSDSTAKSTTLDTSSSSRGNVDEKNKFVKSTLLVIVSNGVLLLSGLLSGFVIPKLLGVEDYAFFKTFTLYASYVSLFQFGFINGIFLRYGGKDFDQLNQGRFRLYSKCLFIVQLLISALIIVAAFAFFSGQTRIVVLLLAPYLFSINCMSYFQQISQITRNFKEYSLLLILQSALKIISIILLWIVSIARIQNLVSFSFYGISYVCIFAILLGYYVFAYRRIIFGKSDKFSEAKADLLSLLKEGIPLLLADFVVTLVYECDRQVVDIGFDKPTFAFFSFAYTITGLVTSLLSGISTVLYPTLKRMGEQERSSLFPKSVSLMIIAGFALIISYFPMAIVIEKWLPNYVSSIPVLKVILPGVAISATINIVIQNYYKTENKNILYFIISLAVLILAIGSDLACYFLFHNTISIALASVIVFFLWFVVSSLIFAKKYKAKITKIYIYTLLCTCVFYVDTFLAKSEIVGLVIYLVVFTFVSLLFFYDEIFGFISSRFGSKMKSAENDESLVKAKDRVTGLSNLSFKIQKNKKLLIKTIGFLGTFFVVVSFCGFFGFDNSQEALAGAVVSERDSQNYDFSYGEIVSSKYPADDFSSVRPYIELTKRTDMLITSKTFYHCSSDESFSPCIIKGPNLSDSISCQVISTVTEKIKSNYGFSLIGQDSISDLDSSQIYVSQGLADKLIASSDNVGIGDYSKLTNFSLDVDTNRGSGALNHAFIIKGVISRSSSSEFNQTFGDSFVWCEYDSLFYFFGGVSFCFFLYGAKAETTTFINLVDSICDKPNSSYKSVYYDHGQNGEFRVNKLQKTKESTKSFYLSHTPRYWFAGIFYCLVIAMLYFGLRYLKRLKTNGSDQEMDFLKSIMPFASIFSFSCVTILFYFLNGIAIGGFVFELLGYKTVTIMILLLILLIVLSTIEDVIEVGGKTKESNIDDRDAFSNSTEIEV